MRKGCVKKNHLSELSVFLLLFRFLCSRFKYYFTGKRVVGITLSLSGPLLDSLFSGLSQGF
jgi:hypothetical protein